MSTEKYRELLQNPDVASKVWKTNGCFTHEELLLMNKLIISKNNEEETQVETYKQEKLKSMSNSQLLDNLYDKLQCDNEKCIHRKAKVYENNHQNNRLLQNETEIFLEDRPKEWLVNKNQWLDNFLIERKMKEYTAYDPTFHFIGPVCRDFRYKESNSGMCMERELCSTDLSRYKQYHPPKEKIGIIFNLDVHTGPGTHWTAMFVNVPKCEIYYYDSVGNAPPKEIKTLLEEMSAELHHGNKDKYQVSRIERQKGSSECGVYAIHFLISLLTEAFTFEEYLKLDLPDEKIEKFRNIFWT